MAMEYINYIKAKAHLATATKSETPVLSEEDEQFLDHIISDENPPPLPPRPRVLDLPIAGETQIKDAQIALLDGAQNIPLPETPQELSEEPKPVDIEAITNTKASKKPAQTWSWLRRDSRDSKRQATAAGLDDIAQGLKHPDATDDVAQNVDEDETKKEEEDMTIVLERLNLAAINNRVFSISDETQELLRKFNLVFKDLIKGVPTAYDDLESLLTNGDKQLQKTFNSLPGFLQKLVEKLPDNMTKMIGPEIMAAAAERAQKSGINMDKAGKAASAATRVGMKNLSLKELVGKPSALAGLLRSIMTFLRTRFPAFMGVNVLWSLAMFLLLIVLWYCHKRGREVREGKEQEAIEEKIRLMEQDEQINNPAPTVTSAGAPPDSENASKPNESSTS